MRPSRFSHWSTMVRPIKLAAKTPVNSTTTMTRTKRKPGMSMPNSDSDDRKPGTNPSRVATSKPSTHTVMTRGPQISRPVMKYFLIWRIRIA
ncbi:hypothetical protein G6F22_020706 [Rhizopus arrhizus]|nr:hypothetical protein G6F22_020706 [Rhizopus arrhizus]